MNKFSSSDRSALIRLASSHPAGDETRKAILAGLAKSSSSMDQNLMEYLGRLEEVELKVAEALYHTPRFKGYSELLALSNRGRDTRAKLYSGYLRADPTPSDITDLVLLGSKLLKKRTSLDRISPAGADTKSVSNFVIAAEAEARRLGTPGVPQ